LGIGDAPRKTEGGIWYAGGTVEVDVGANDEASVLVSAVTWRVEADVTVDVVCDGIRRLPPETRR
jgi:hypothetical protein